MPTHWFYGYTPDAFTSPEPGTMQLDPDWDVQDDAYDFHITDDDSQFQGDSNTNETSDDGSQQTGVVYNSSGGTVASGSVYLEEAYVLTDGYGNTVRLYRVEIGGTHVGYIADGPIQPGNTYTFSSTENVNDSNAPQYSNLEDQSYNRDASNDISGTTNDDTLNSGSGNDTVAAGDGDDSIDGGTGTDSIDGGSGADTISGGSGNDTITGGTGQDSIDGGAGDDSIDGGSNADSITGGDGADTIFGGTGQDTIDGGAGNDSIDGGGGADTIHGGTGDDSILGGDGDDSLTGGDEGTVTSSDSIDTSNYSDTSSGYTVTAQNVSGGALTAASVANVSTNGGGLGATGAVSDSDSGQDSQLAFDKASGISERLIVDFDQDVTSASFSFQSLFTDGFGEVGHWAIYNDGVLVSEADFTEDTVGSGTGTVDLSGFGAFDQIIFTALLQTDGTDGSDYVITDISYTQTLTETSDDTIAGGAGADTIDGGTGDDSLTGGTGDDTFLYAPGDGHDTISDFNTGNTGTLTDGDSTNNDFIDLSGYYDNLSELYADQADDGILNQSNTTDTKGRSVDYSDNTQFGPEDSMTFQGASADNSSFTQENTGVVCFTSGTAIRTPQGDVLIDDLKVGDLVCTLDNGPQPIRWIGRRTLGAAELAAHTRLRPVLIRRGTLGAERDMLVSQQHGILMPDQTLIRAKFLAEAKGNPLRIAHGRRSVTYIHLLFEAHQIIFAENVRSESLYPGKMAFDAMGEAAQAELAELFPELDTDFPAEPQHWYGNSARLYLKRREALQDGGRIAL